MSFFVTSNSEGSFDLTTAGYTVLVLVMIALVICGAAVFGKKKHFSARQLAFSGVSIAIATVLSMIPFVQMPMGGKLTLFSMFFITIIGWFYGFGTGLTCAIAYGIIQLLLDPYILSFPQMLTDYILAFGALGLAGLFWKMKHGLQIGYLVGILGRLFFSFLSGVIFFGVYAPDSFKLFGQTIPLNPYSYSFLYNAFYILGEGILTLIVISLPPVNKALKTVRRTAQEGLEA